MLCQQEALMAINFSHDKGCSIAPPPNKGAPYALKGTNGDDTHLIGSSVDGGPGNDIITGTGNASGTIPGNDYLKGGPGADSIRPGFGNDFVDGGPGNDTFGGGPGNDTLLGRQGNDSLSGGPGDDKVYGGQGADTISGSSSGNDCIHGGSGNDRLNGGIDDDVVQGDSGNDFIVGNLGNDTLYGGSGNDTLRGDAGDDLLFGGAGKDVFYFGKNSGHDVIADFSKFDQIDVRGLGLSSFADVQAHLTSHGDGLTLTANGTTIDILHVTHLTAADFII